MSKQTAIEWLESQLLKQKSILKNHFEEGKWNDDRCSEIDNCLLFIQQAKEMEKEQIISSYNEGMEGMSNNPEVENYMGVEYYNLTYRYNK